MQKFYRQNIYERSTAKQPVQHFDHPMLLSSTSHQFVCRLLCACVNEYASKRRQSVRAHPSIICISLGVRLKLVTHFSHHTNAFLFQVRRKV